MQAQTLRKLLVGTSYPYTPPAELGHLAIARMLLERAGASAAADIFGQSHLWHDSHVRRLALRKRSDEGAAQRLRIWEATEEGRSRYGVGKGACCCCFQWN